MSLEETGLPFAGQVNSLFGCDLGFLDDTVEQDDFLIHDDEKHAGNARFERGADFP